MENIISGSRTNKSDLEREKYAKDNLNNYVHSGSSFMEFTKQRKNLGIDKTETIDSKNGIDYLQKKHNIFKNPENLLNQAERNKNQEEGLADIYTKNYMKEKKEQMAGMIMEKHWKILLNWHQMVKI